MPATCIVAEEIVVEEYKVEQCDSQDDTDDLGTTAILSVAASLGDIASVGVAASYRIITSCC